MQAIWSPFRDHISGDHMKQIIVCNKTSSHTYMYDKVILYLLPKTINADGMHFDSSVDKLLDYHNISMCHKVSVYNQVSM